MKSGKLLIGLISGAAAGAVAGLLFAPKKGADTRKKIAHSKDNYLKDAKHRLDEFSDNLNHKVEALKAKGKAKASSSKSEEKINEAKAEMHELKAS